MRGLDHQHPNVRWVSAWILFAVFCQCAGWGLSVVHSLNAVGYAVVFAVGAAFIAIRAVRSKIGFPASNAAKLKRRFSRAFPLAWLLLAALAILGGILYAPNNYDAHSYRTPRVLHWLAEGRWHWIHTHFGNLNTRGNGFEWITAPLFAFAKSDRFEFVINAICFLLLPGRVFAILTRLKASPRVAYAWMWIFPTAYGFLLQAGSIGNDLFAALWPMTALEFALRAPETKRIDFVFLSILSAALMTSSKAFNLLLLPAWGIAILPSLPILFRRPLGTLVIIAIAAVSSLIPTAILNKRHCGDWTGLAAEPVKLNNGPPVFQVGVNAVLVTLHNFAPPIFPFTGAWDRVVARVLPASTAERLQKYFEADAARLRIGELQVEEIAGLGFGVSILIATIVLRQIFGSRRNRTALVSYPNLIAAAAFGGIVIFMARSGLYAPARYILPQCLPALTPLFALPAAATLVRKRWWRALVMLTFAAAGLLVIVSPARPLWPAKTLLSDGDAPLLKRARAVYSTYAQRADVLRPIRESLPPDAKAVGFISMNAPETSLWRPFGSRRVLHIRREDTPQFTRSRGFEYVVIEPNGISGALQTTADEWLRANNAQLVRRFPIQILARDTPAEWLLVKLNP